jgi:RNA-directed DNA polymerase
LHHAIYRILYPYSDKKFIFDSYSCRLEKGTHRAINRFRYFSRIVSKNNTKTCFILKCDIRKFFANIDHQILKDVLSKYIEDKDTLWLLNQIIDSFHTTTTTNSARAEFVVPKNDGLKGLPLGNLTSQLLVNIYMNEFDQFMKHKIKENYYIRYADDFVIFSNDKIYLENLISEISEFLNNNLRLCLHPDKVFIKILTSGLDFLGWVNFPKHRVLRTSTKRRMFRNIRKNLRKETIISYLGMLKHGNGYKLKIKIKNHYNFLNFVLVV